MYQIGDGSTGIHRKETKLRAFLCNIGIMVYLTEMWGRRDSCWVDVTSQYGNITAKLLTKLYINQAAFVDELCKK